MIDFVPRPPSARMVPVRHTPSDLSDGHNLPRLRHGGGPTVDGEQKTIPDKEHLSRLQRCAGPLVFVYVL